MLEAHLVDWDIVFKHWTIIPLRHNPEISSDLFLTFEIDGLHHTTAEISLSVNLFSAGYLSLFALS